MSRFCEGVGKTKNVIKNAKRLRSLGKEESGSYLFSRVHASEKGCEGGIRAMIGGGGAGGVIVELPGVEWVWVGLGKVDGVEEVVFRLGEGVILKIGTEEG